MNTQQDELVVKLPCKRCDGTVTMWITTWVVDAAFPCTACNHTGVGEVIKIPKDWSKGLFDD